MVLPLWLIKFAKNYHRIEQSPLHLEWIPLDKNLRLELGTDLDQMYSIRKADESNKIKMLFDPWNIRAKSYWYERIVFKLGSLLDLY